jgi:hypothetical protein
LKYFAKQKRSAGGESDTEKKAIAEYLIKEKWEPEEKGHETAVFSYHEAIAKCDQYPGVQF